MQLAKLKFVVSCSDSEPGFGAENLLGSSKNGRTKWRGKAGNSSNVAVLQMERQFQIKAVDIGNEFSALITVLVTKSCDSKQNFQTLIPSTSFMDPMESRLAKNGNRVKMFLEDDMITATAKQEWDVVKIVCTQPFNQTKPYGISFITVTVEGEETESIPRISKIGVPKIPLITRVETLKNPLEAGEMFKHKENYRNVRESLVAQKSKGKEIKDDAEIEKMELWKHKQKLSCSLNAKHLKVIKNKENEEILPNSTVKIMSDQNDSSELSTSKVVACEEQRFEKLEKQIKPNAVRQDPLSQVLRGVRFSLSGYQNPQRSILRDKAKEMGALYENDWSSRCTHLVCAFRNTPKYRQVGKSGIIVTDKWIEMCYLQKKRLPERHFAL